MEGDFTPQERHFATLLVHEQMLRELWVRVLASEADPVDEADAYRSLARSELEEYAPGVTSRESARVLHLATEISDEKWEQIIGQLVEDAGPIPFAPTALGTRIADRLRAAQQARKPEGEPDGE